MYHVSHQGQQFGPYTLEQINEYLAQGAFDASSHVWDANVNGWVEIWQLPGVILPAAHGSTIVPTKPARASNSGLAFSTVGILLFVVSVIFIITRMGKADDWAFGKHLAGRTGPEYELDVNPYIFPNATYIFLMFLAVVGIALLVVGIRNIRKSK